MKEDKINISLLLTFIVIFVSNDTLLFGTNANRLFFWGHIGILLITFIYLLINSHGIKRNVMIFVVFMVFFMMTTLLVNGDREIIKYAYNIFILIMSAFFCSCVRKNDFCKAFVIIIYYIALCSIILFLLWLVANPIVRFFPSITNESGINYYYLGLGFLEDLNPGTLPRMYGVFREPGVFTCYLILSLIIQLFFLKKLIISRVVVISLASLLTFSTAAYILLILIFTAYLINQIFNYNKHNNIIKLLLILSIMNIAVIYLLGPDKIFGIVFNKLNVENSSRDSRFSSISANLLMFMQNPLLGKGWNYVEDQFIEFAKLDTYQGTHNTNTFLKLLALYGIFPFIGDIGAHLYYFIKETKSLLFGLFITAIWIVALSNEDMTVNILIYLLPFYAFSKDSETRKDICEDSFN